MASYDDLLRGFIRDIIVESPVKELQKSSPDFESLLKIPAIDAITSVKRRKSFPLPSDYLKSYDPDRPVDPSRPTDSPIQDGGDDGPVSIEIEDIDIDPSVYAVEEKKLSGYEKLIDDKFGMPQDMSLAKGRQQVTGVGPILGVLTGLTGVSTTLANAIGRYNRNNLNTIAAKAALGLNGYGVGVLNGIEVGVTPTDAIVQGTTLQLTRKQTQEVKQALAGKSGALGSAYQDFTEGGGAFETGKTYSPQEIGYREAVLGSQIPDNLKASLLGFDPNTNYSFSPGRLQAQFNVTTPQNYMQKTSFVDYVGNKKATEKNRAGNVEDGSFTDVSAPSMGLETDIDAQQSQVNPMSINLGIDMDNISGVPTGVQGLDTVSPVSSLTASSSVSPSYYSDNESGDNQTSAGGSSGFGGGGWTAYGGRIQKAYGGGENKGFTSKTPDKITIQGVGLIKPEETFLKTDTVRDRYDLEARENDFIVNGPTSEQFKKPILAFINQAETNLKNKGVDINVGKPTIPVSKQVPLLVASSETYIPKEYIEAFNPDNPEEGYDILEAMNNVGRPEVTRLKSQIDKPTDQNKYQANEGMRVSDPRQGFLSGRPKLNLTGPNIDKTENAFVLGISDEPAEMTLDQQRYFGDYEFGDIKKAIKRTEIQGFEKDPYIFTGVKAKKGEASSAFGPMQITAKTLEDFKNRSPEYSSLDKNEKSYIEALLAQGEDKINLELYSTLKRGPKEKRVNVTASNFYKGKEKGLKPYGKGVINPNLHKKYYDKIADRVLMHKLGDHETIEKALASYGEGANYSQKVLNDLLDIMQGVEPPTKVTSK